jgi:hypothetical protein
MLKVATAENHGQKLAPNMSSRENGRKYATDNQM